MNQALEKILISSLEQLEQGYSPEAILERYPEDADELRPYLETAAQLTALSSQPSLAAQQQSQADFLAAASALGGAQTGPSAAVPLLRRLFMPLASLALILLLFGFALVTLSAAALPGDALYAVKRGVEEIRLSLASDPEQILELSRSFQEERLREIEALLREGRTADVLFEGEIEAIAEQQWVVGGLAVQITAETRIEGTPQSGELARVEGRTAAGQLIGELVAVLTGRADDEEEPLPAVVPTRETLQPTPTPAVTGLPPAAATPQATVEVQGDYSVIPENDAITPTASPTPTADLPTAVPGNNDNEDTGDSGGAGINENSGDETDENENQPGSDDNDSGDDGSGGDENDNGQDGEGGGDENGQNGEGGGDQNDNGGDDNDNGQDGEGGDENDNGQDGEGGDENDNGQDGEGDDENDNGGGDDNDNDNSDDDNDNDNSGDDNDNDNDNSDDEEDSGGGDDNDNDNGDDVEDSGGGDDNDNDNSDDEEDSGDGDGSRTDGGPSSMSRASDALINDQQQAKRR